MATNALYLAIRVDDRQANRAIDDINRGLDGIGDHARRGGDAAGRAIEKLRERLIAAQKIPPPPVPVERMRQLAEETQRVKSQIGLLSGATVGLDKLAGAFRGILGTVLGTYGALLTLEGALKELVGSAKFAARTEQLGYALNAVGSAAGLTTRAVHATSIAIERQGFTAQSARETLARLIAANIDYRRAADLARASQDLGRVAGIASTEAYQRLTHAIVTLQPEMLRTLGLSVNLERGYRQYAKAVGRSADDLTEVEKRQIALNLALQSATAYTGVYEESAKTAGGQLLSMQRYYDDLRQAIGERFLPVFTQVVDKMVVFLQVAKENISVLETAYRLWKLVPGPIISTLNAINSVTEAYEKWTKLLSQSDRKYTPSFEEQAADRIYRDAAKKREELTKHIGVGSTLSALEGLQVGIDEMKRQMGEEVNKTLKQDLGATGKAVKEWAQWASTSIQADFFGAGMSPADIIRAHIEMIDKAREESDRKREEERKKWEQRAAQALERSRQMVEKAQLSELSGFEKINRERQIALRDIGLTAKAVRNVNAAFDIEVAQEQRRLRELGGKFLVESFKDARRAARELQDERNKAFLQDLQLEQERWKYRMQTADEAIAFEEVRLTQSKELELAKLDAVAKRDLGGKLALEEAKLEIERRYAQKSLELQLKSATSKAQIEATNNPQFSAEIMERLEQRKLQIAEQTQSSIELMEQRSIRTRQQMQIDAWEDAWQRSKRAAEDVFDALTARGRSFGDYFKTLWLTVLREIVTSHVARVFMGMFGASPSGGYGGGSPMRPAGALGGLIGVGGFGFPGMPGGTGGFAGPVGGTGVGGGNWTGWGSIASSYKGLLAKLGGAPKTVFDEMGQATTYGKGIYGSAGGALLLGGGALATAGLMRGGWSGLGMTASGGALIGAKFGGPIGAVIGGAIGGVAGLVRMFFKGATEKTKQKIRALYGVDVKDKGVLQQVVDMAKQSFGGNIDMAIRAPQIRELLELYAMSTGQKFGVNTDVVRPFVASQSGGQIWQQVQYDAGRAYTHASTLPTFGGGTANVQVIIDGQSAAAAWQGEVVQAAIVQNGRTVQSAANKAARGNHLRRANWAQGIAPTQVLA